MVGEAQLDKTRPGALEVNMRNSPPLARITPRSPDQPRFIHGNVSILNRLVFGDIV